MKNIKHISLDVWNTLLIPNVQFAVERTKFLAEYFDVSEEIAKIKFTKTKNILEEISKVRGICISQPAIFALLINQFNNENINADGNELRKMFITLFQKYPPILLNSTKYELERINKNTDITLGITSNTGFISGVFISHFINSQVDVDFKVNLFSDLVTFAKPSMEIFKMHFDALNNWTYVNDLPKIEKSEIIHIGDNIDCDVIGAINFGFEHQWINDAAALPDILKGYA